VATDILLIRVYVRKYNNVRHCFSMTKWENINLEHVAGFPIHTFSFPYILLFAIDWPISTYMVLTFVVYCNQMPKFLVSSCLVLFLFRRILFCTLFYSNLYYIKSLRKFWLKFPFYFFSSIIYQLSECISLIRIISFDEKQNSKK
jgi:hypothetical protein